MKHDEMNNAIPTETAKKLVDRLLLGCEVVVVSANENYNSAIFYTDKFGHVWSWSREIGNIGPMNIGAVEKHFAKMAEEGASLFVRGMAE